MDPRLGAYKQLIEAVRNGVKDEADNVELTLGEKKVNGEVSVDGTAKVSGVNSESKVMGT